ncbi:MAG: ADP-ribosylglycohydrolase family protein [Chloroflexota bacterium]|nr:ADP-ribosylglycohydrolase family protein [Chloroflexota bacterium]
MSLETAKAIVYGVALGAGDGGVADVFALAEISYRYHTDLRKLHKAAHEHGRLSSDHIKVAAACVAAAFLIALPLNGAHDHEYARRVVEFTDGLSDALDAAFYRLGHVLAWGDEGSAIAHIGKDGGAEALIGLACYCVMRYPTEFDKAMALGRMCGLIPAALAGGILGAKLGLAGITQTAIVSLKDVDRLDEMAVNWMMKGRF